MARKIPDTDPTTRITDVTTNWLQREIRDSDRGRNRVLSEFALRISDFYLPFEASGNQMAAKAKGHYSRMKLLLNAYRDHRTQFMDGVTAKLIHHTLMEVSGSWRKQCYFEAASPEDYRNRRHRSPAGIELRPTVEAAPSIAAIDNMDEVVEATWEANEQSLERMRSLHEWVADQQPEQLPLTDADAVPVVAMRETQRMWIGVTAVHILAAADLRGRLEDVPFLEPKSISDVSTHPHYPFA